MFTEVDVVVNIMLNLLVSHVLRLGSMKIAKPRVQKQLLLTASIAPRPSQFSVSPMAALRWYTLVGVSSALLWKCSVHILRVFVQQLQ